MMERFARGSCCLEKWPDVLANAASVLSPDQLTLHIKVTGRMVTKRNQIYYFMMILFQYLVREHALVS